MGKKYLIIVMIALMLSFTGCSKSSSNIKKYLNSGAKIDTYAKDFMPAIEDLPEYKNIQYKYDHKPNILSDTDTINLVIEYDDETYSREKEKLASSYSFLSKEIISKYPKNKYIVPEYEFSINDYDFKVVEENNKSSADYPKSFCMIGTSDEKKSIAYLYFYDDELDFIGEKQMANFVKKNFNYDF